MAFKFALSVADQYESLKFLIIADDDSFINVKGFHEELFLKANPILKEVIKYHNLTFDA